MRAAAVFPGNRRVGMVNGVPEPKLESLTGVKLRVLQVGICATDREIASFMFGTPPEGFEYLVMGHEGFAEVIEAGPEVPGLKPGDLVIPTVRRPCDDPACAACRHDRSDFCITGLYREHGILSMHGFMTEFVVDEARYMRPRAAITRAIGADYVSSQDCTPAQMAARIGNIDLIYEATGSATLAFDMLNVLGRNGILILTGVPGAHGPQAIDIGALITNMTLKNQCVVATVNAGNDAFDRAIADLTAFRSKWPDAARGLITGRFKLEQFETPIRDASGIKSIIEMAS